MENERTCQSPTGGRSRYPGPQRLGKRFSDSIGWTRSIQSVARAAITTWTHASSSLSVLVSGGTTTIHSSTVTMGDVVGVYGALLSTVVAVIGGIRWLQARRPRVTLRAMPLGSGTIYMEAI